MKLSIIIVFFNMKREAARTLYGFSAAHQIGVSPEDYEVIAIDNGSTAPLSEQNVLSHGPNFRFLSHKTASVSPVNAVNTAVASSQGEYVAVIVDGARMPSPGLVSQTLSGLRLAQRPLVYARSWHLGPDVQNKTMLDGYDQKFEDEMLRQCDWREDGYRLFSISTLAQSSAGGFFGPIPSEFSYFSVSRNMFDALGGFDERFVSKGGGLVNQHFRDRAISYQDTSVIQIIGEGVFHQFHGGVATNVPLADHPRRSFGEEYAEITGQNYAFRKDFDQLYIGPMPDAARAFL